MKKWPVDGSVADRPEGVLQNVRENSGLATAITTRPPLISRGRYRRLPSRLYIQVAFGSSAACDLVWRLGRGLSGEMLANRTNWQRNEFCPVKVGILRDYRCMVEGLMSITYLELCDFVKYIL
ncbi:MAG: hypothetical protein ACLVGR_02765 [Anaerovoracaceae bacterium]